MKGIEGKREIETQLLIIEVLERISHNYVFMEWKLRYFDLQRLSGRKEQF